MAVPLKWSRPSHRAAGQVGPAAPGSEEAGRAEGDLGTSPQKMRLQLDLLGFGRIAPQMRAQAEMAGSEKDEAEQISKKDWLLNGEEHPSGQGRWQLEMSICCPTSVRCFSDRANWRGTRGQSTFTPLAWESEVLTSGKRGHCKLVIFYCPSIAE